MDERENGIYKQRKYYAIALDPVHIGTGGYRIGRVDNTIVREPATGIPKIPGTTIEGVCRSYAYLRNIEKGEFNTDDKRHLACAKGKKIKIKEEVTEKGEKKIVEVEKEPCGECKICITFGYTSDAKSGQAMALFSDARILFFPVATMIGPVWVTCPMVLRDSKLDSLLNSDLVPNNYEFIAANKLGNILPEKEGDTNTRILNFGWLLLEGKCANVNLSISGINSEILDRVVIVSDTLFPQIVNSNLEVRTSVAIDPERGAAEERALFTYEAIPRGTVFWFEVTYTNPEFYQIDSINGCNSKLKKCIIETVESGLSLFEYLGLGGMNSRGFGRLKVLNLGDGDGDK